MVALHKELVDLERLIRSGAGDLRPEGERSPSPPPTYDAAGQRLNTREVRAREKQARRRNAVIEALLGRDPGYRPPADYRPEKKTAKLFIPYKQFPDYNFIGLIIGPRGNTQKRMQSETNTKIAIRGRGSVKEGASRDPKYDYGEVSARERVALVVERVLPPLVPLLPLLPLLFFLLFWGCSCARSRRRSPLAPATTALPSCASAFANAPLTLPLPCPVSPLRRRTTSTCW